MFSHVNNGWMIISCLNIIICGRRERWLFVSSHSIHAIYTQQRTTQHRRYLDFRGNSRTRHEPLPGTVDVRLHEKHDGGDLTNCVCSLVAITAYNRNIDASLSAANDDDSPSIFLLDERVMCNHKKAIVYPTRRLIIYSSFTSVLVM